MNTHSEQPLWTPRRKAGVAGLLLIQLVVAYLVGTGHWLTNDSMSPLPPIGITVAVPVLVFLAAYGLSPGFRGFVLAQDLRRLTMIQHWRVIGFAFLLLYAFGVLPGLFAWPAGIGDVAIGVTAIFMVSRIERDPDFVTASGFVWFNIVGLLDFATAIVTSSLANGRFPELVPDGVTAAPMDVWPLNLFPSLIVPAFIILHLVVLLKVRALRRANAAGSPLTMQPV